MCVALSAGKEQRTRSRPVVLAAGVVKALCLEHEESVSHFANGLQPPIDSIRAVKLERDFGLHRAKRD